MFATVLTNRIQAAITNVFGERQTCRVRSRIHMNTDIARSVLDLCIYSVRRVALIRIDLQRAFDRVKYDVVFSVLSHICFGSVIFEGGKMVYTNYTPRIINRKLNDSINVPSSVRRGCPMSPLIFALYLEPYSMSMEQNLCIREF